MSAVDDARAAEMQRIKALRNPVAIIHEATLALGDAQRLVNELAKVRRKAVDAMISDGFTLREIADAVGLSIPRIGQLSTRQRAREG